MAHPAPRSLAPAAGFVSPALSQRAVLMAGIIGFHVVLVYLLATGLGANVLKYVEQPIEVQPYDERVPDTTPPPPADPDFVPAVVDVPYPDVPITEAAGDTAPVFISPARVDPPPAAPPVARPDPIRLVGKNMLPSSEDYYPPTARRDGTEGAANVQVCVDERGKRQGEPTVTQSSGDARLDKGAVALARDGRYARSMRGDAYVPNCFGFRVIFTMQK
jgi:TonB family protein